MSRHRPYPAYKESAVEWLGEQPAHWKTTKLKFIANVNMGQSPSSDDCNEDGVGEPFLQGNAEFKERFPIARQFCTVAKKRANKGDLLFSVRAPVGALNEADSVYGIGRGLCAITPGKAETSSYLWWVLGTSKSQLSAVSTGSTFDSVSAEQVENIYVSCPAPDEQASIANFLDQETAKIDDLIAKQERLIELLKEKRQAVISHAVTKGLNPGVPMKDSGMEWLGEIPEHWKTKVKLANLAEKTWGSFVNGPFGSDLLSNELTDEGIPVVYIRDIKRTGYKRKSTVFVTEEKANQLKVCRVKPFDVLVAKVGDPPGDACVYPENEPDAIITQDVIRIRVDRSTVDHSYLSHLLNSDFGVLIIDEVSVESTRKRIGLGDFKGTRFILPPLYEQREIVKFIDIKLLRIDSLINKASTAISLSKERRTALISAAVTGKIDVRNWQPNTH